MHNYMQPLVAHNLGELVAYHDSRSDENMVADIHDHINNTRTLSEVKAEIKAARAIESNAREDRGSQ